MQQLAVPVGCLALALACPAQAIVWTQANPTAAPSARSEHAMAYDSARKRTVLFGGVW